MTQSDTIGEGWQDIAAERAKALARLSYFPGTWDKRFTRDVAAIVTAGRELTEKQAENVERLAWKYRRQLPPRLIPNPPGPHSGASGVGQGDAS